jgi:hypothetical protein
VNTAVTPPAAMRNHDLDGGLIRAAQVVQSRRRAMGEDGPGAAGEHGREESSPSGQELWRDEGVDGAMDAVELPAGCSFANGRRRQPKLAELTQPEHAMLAPAEVGKPALVT